MEKYNVQQIEWCGDCQTDVCRPCATEIMQLSEAGQLLRDNVKARYSSWWWQDLERFKQFMGPDVDPVLHGPHQAEMVVKPFVEMQNSSHYGGFSQDDARVLYTANLFHDVHEGITGDVPKPQKTAETDLEELRVNREVVRELMGWADDHPLLEQMQAVMGDSTGSTILGRAFEAIERCGYLQTGLRAWSMREHSSLSWREKLQSADMGRIVALDAANHLNRFAIEFAYPAYLLETSAPALREMALTG